MLQAAKEALLLMAMFRVRLGHATKVIGWGSVGSVLTAPPVVLCRLVCYRCLDGGKSTRKECLGLIGEIRSDQSRASCERETRFALEHGFAWSNIVREVVVAVAQ